MALARIVKAVMIGSLVLAALAFWRKDALPPAAGLRPELNDEPKQVELKKAPFETSVGGVKYGIEPRFTYDLNGLVVSMHHSDAWWDYAHREWGDHVNVVDLCVVWGENVRRDAYRAISFSNTQWECHYSTGSSEAWRAFDEAAVSNNHMVTDSPAVARSLKNVHVGDQVHFRGYLADYTIYKNGAPAGKRVTSTTRTDTGPGACEVVYVEDFEILGSANRGWRILGVVALALFVLSLIAWFALPVKFDD
jgi:hypothetical protein